MANLPEHPRCPYCGSYSTERHWGDQILQFGAGVIGGIANAVVDDQIGFCANDETIARYANKIVNEFTQRYTCSKCNQSFDLTNNNAKNKSNNIVNHANANIDQFTYLNTDRRISIKDKELKSTLGKTETDIISTVQRYALKYSKKSQKDFSRNEVVRLSKKLGLDTDVLHSRLDYYLNAKISVIKNNDKPSLCKKTLNYKSNNDSKKTLSYSDSLDSFEKLTEKSIEEFKNRLDKISGEYGDISNIPKRLLSDLGKSCGLSISEVREIINEKDNEINKTEGIWENSENIITSDIVSMGDSNSANEQIYIDEFIQCLNDHEISVNERRILSRLAKTLNITESRVIQLEASCISTKLSELEKEYFEELIACLEDSPKIGDGTNRLLKRFADSLGIPEKRQQEIQEYIKLLHYASL